MNLFFYRWLTRLLCPPLWLWDTWRAYRQPIYRPQRSERWVGSMPPPISNRLIWIHAVSVGETQACAPLLRALLAQYPKHAVLLTHMTPTGRDTGAKLFADEIGALRVQQCYLPYDVAGLPERFLKHFRPMCGMLMETEIWPNCVAACVKIGIPIGLANARLSEKTLQQSLKFKPLSCTTFNAFAWVGAQSDLDAQRLAQLRSKTITVAGNLKFDARLDEAQWQQGQAFKTQQGRLTLTLASTREGEEALLLNILKPWLAGLAKPPLILLVPRHPKRADELVNLMQPLGLSTAQRSKGQSPSASTQIYLGDTLGEMWFYFGASDIALVGGGWLPFGGQNLIEPCMAGCATLVGTHMFNFADATQLAIADAAIIQTELESLCSTLNGLLEGDAKNKLSASGQAFASKHTGSTKKHMALIKNTIDLED